MLVSSSADCTVKLWQLSSGHKVGKLVQFVSEDSYKPYKHVTVVGGDLIVCGDDQGNFLECKSDENGIFEYHNEFQIGIAIKNTHYYRKLKKMLVISNQHVYCLDMQSKSVKNLRI